jgi:hypothetical protein
MHSRFRVDQPQRTGGFFLLAACAALWASAALSAEPVDSGPPVVVTPNAFRGSDVERINQAIAAGAKAGCRVVIPRVNLRDGRPHDVWLLDSAIILPGDTTLDLDNCRIKLSDRCRDNVMRSANCGLGITKIQMLRNIHVRGIGRVVLEGADRPRSTGDSSKKLGGQTYGTDAGVAGESQTGDWRNIGILLAYVEGFSIENVAIRDSHCWGISLERCNHGRLRDIDFDSSSFKVIDGAVQPFLTQDGVDLRLGCHDILIESITGHTGDDLVALTAVPAADMPAGSTSSTMVSDCKDRGSGRDDIRHVIIRNIRGHSRGRHQIVRLLNTSGARMHDILLDGLVDTSPDDVRCKAAVKIGDGGYGAGVAPLGDTSRIIVQNVVSQATRTIEIGGSLCDSIIANIVRRGSGEAVTLASGPANVRNVTIANVRVVE